MSLVIIEVCGEGICMTNDLCRLGIAIAVVIVGGVALAGTVIYYAYRRAMMRGE